MAWSAGGVVIGKENRQIVFDGLEGALGEAVFMGKNVDVAEIDEHVGRDVGPFVDKKTGQAKPVGEGCFCGGETVGGDGSGETWGRELGKGLGGWLGCGVAEERAAQSAPNGEGEQGSAKEMATTHIRLKKRSILKNQPKS